MTGHIVDSVYTSDSVLYTLDGDGCPNGKYTFSGWKNGNTPVSAGSTLTLTNDIILNGNWTYSAVNDLSATVTFVVVNGKWTDDTTLNKTKRVALKKNGVFAADGEAPFTSSDIPTGIPTTPQYTGAGTWSSNKTSSTIAPNGTSATVKEAVTFTLTYAPAESYTVQYFTDNKPVNDAQTLYNNAKVTWGNTDTASVNYSKYSDSGFALDRIEITNQPTVYPKINGSMENVSLPSTVANGTAVSVYFATDSISAETNGEDSDGIPDKYQATIIYQIANNDMNKGSFNGSSASSVQNVITLKSIDSANNETWATQEEITINSDTRTTPPTPVANDGFWSNGWQENNASVDFSTAKKIEGGKTYTFTTGFSTKNEIEVHAASNTVTYDGQEHEISGIASNSNTFTRDETTYYVSLNQPIRVTGTDANTYTLELTSDNIIIRANSENGEDVTNQFDITTVNGTLTINKRNVTLTSGSGEKVYDGTALTNDTVIVGGDDWAKGEGATYNVTGSQLLPDSSENTFTYTPKEGTKEANYNITKIYGTLTVTRSGEESDPFARTFHAQSATVTYDGKPHTISGINSNETSFEINGERYTVQATDSVTVTGTDAGTYQLALPERNVTIFNGNNEDVTNLFAIATIPGTLTINKRPVTLTSGSSSKVYDGSALTNSTVTVGGMGWVNNDSATYSVTGSQRSVGSSSNAFTYTLNEGTNPDNYDILPVFGTLTVFSDSTDEPEETEPTRRPRDPGENNNTTNIDDTRTPQADLTDITDLETPLADMGLNTTDHYAYLAGFNDGTIRPLNNITRAEVATILFRLMSDNYRTANWATTNSFPDVKPDEWYTTAISTIAKASLMSGDSSGNFRPNDPITRGEFASIAARLASADTVASASFSDTAGHWAESAINTAAGAGWIKGSSGQFRPNAYITRAEAATIVNAMVERHPDKEHLLDNMTVWPDNPETEWYYTAIQEATNTHDYELETQLSESWTKLGEARNWSALMSQWQQTAEQSVPLSDLPVDGLPITGTP